MFYVIPLNVNVYPNVIYDIEKALLILTVYISCHVIAVMSY